MNLKTKQLSIDLRARFFFVLVSISAISLGVYVYALIATVHHTMAKEELTAKHALLSVQVSELEYQGLALKHEVNLDTALSQGFTEVRSPLYVSRLAPSLTLHTQER